MKVGDRVICIENKWSIDNLEVGNEYEIIKINPDGRAIDVWDVEWGKDFEGAISTNEPVDYFELNK